MHIRSKTKMIENNMDTQNGRLRASIFIAMRQIWELYRGSYQG